VNVSELFLYAGFVVGWLAGRRWPARGPWVGRATLIAVIVLVALLGASFRSIDGRQLLEVLPAAVVVAMAIVVATAGVFLALRRRLAAPAGSVRTANPIAPDRLPTSALLLAALFAGYGVGRTFVLPTGLLLTVALALLLGLVGYSIDLDPASVRRAWVPILSAAASAVAVASALVVLDPGLAPSAFPTALGFGWYSLAGPLVAARLGAVLGLFAFLVNFLREALTMVLAPYLGPHLKGEGLAAVGGATSMDTTLYFVVRYGDSRSGALSVASGLTLTVAASLLVPLALAL
jgi:uncharacterized membrane protein YbjE (DUF340 family)